MATTSTRWYQNPRVRRYLARSEYISAFTNWFMGLTGRATELVLYATVLYSSAQLYPHVQLPAGLSLAVFLIQMGALDVGGLALGKLAKQARADGNTEGAEQAAQLSQWLIGIMLAGVVTVGLEHALPFTLPNVVTVSIDVVLVVARSICAVLYGRVVHDLKTDSAIHQADELSQQLTEQFSRELTTALTQLRQELSPQASELSQMFSNQLSELSQQFTQQQQNQGSQIATIRDAIGVYEQALGGLAALPGIIERHEHATRQALAGMRASLESSAKVKPKLSLVTNPITTEKLTPDEGELTNRQFIEDHLSKHPEARNIDVIEAGSKYGLTISQSQVSQVRRALKELSA
jgi:hypothetical protein